MFDLVIISLFSALVFIAGALALLARKHFRTASKPSHPCEIFHDFIVINSQQPKTEPPQTIVLKICSRCNTHAWFAYMGAWELGDFLRKESEIAQLERMAR